jgi:hypothetical protein
MDRSESCRATNPMRSGDAISQTWPSPPSWTSPIIEFYATLRQRTGRTGISRSTKSALPKESALVDCLAGLPVELTVLIHLRSRSELRPSATRAPHRCQEGSPEDGFR